MQQTLEHVLSGAETPESDPNSVWDEWNAKSPRRQVDDALVADEALLHALEDVDTADRERATFAMGPLTMSFAEFSGARAERAHPPHLGRRGHVRPVGPPPG